MENETITSGDINRKKEVVLTSFLILNFFKFDFNPLIVSINYLVDDFIKNT